MDNVKSELDIALEFISQYPDAADALNPDEFAVFFEKPTEVLKEYQRNIAFLKTSFGFTDEMVQENCVGFLNEACTHVSNLKANNP